MSDFHSKMKSFIAMGIAVILPNFSLAQSQTSQVEFLSYMCHLKIPLFSSSTISYVSVVPWREFRRY